MVGGIEYGIVGRTDGFSVAFCDSKPKKKLIFALIVKAGNVYVQNCPSGCTPSKAC